MKKLEKNGYTFVYIDDELMNDIENTKFGTNFCVNEDAPNQWMVVVSETDSDTYLMSKEEVYEHALSFFNLSHDDEDYEMNEVAKESTKEYTKILYIWP